MGRFEEEVVERWYNLREYLTVKNIVYDSPATRPGGLGRGEIDLLALKLTGEGQPDCVRIEVGVGITAKFPWIDRKDPSVDEANRILKKFFSRGADLKAKNYFGSSEYKYVLISSEIADNATDLLSERLKELNARLVAVDKCEPKMVVRIAYEPQDREIWISGERKIEILPFSYVLQSLKELFEREKLIGRDFGDLTMRSLQHMFKTYKLLQRL